MTKITLSIKNKLGIHARPAALLAKMAGRYKSKIMLVKDSQEIDCKSILGIMMLAVEYEAVVEITAHGEDDQEAVKNIEDLINGRFSED